MGRGRTALRLAPPSLLIGASMAIGWWSSRLAFDAATQPYGSPSIQPILEASRTWEMAGIIIAAIGFVWLLAALYRLSARRSPK